MNHEAAIGFDFGTHRYSVASPCRVPELCHPSDILLWGRYALAWLSIAAKLADTPERQAQVGRLAQQVASFIARAEHSKFVSPLKSQDFWPDSAIGAVVSAAQLAAGLATEWSGQTLESPSVPDDVELLSWTEQLRRYWQQAKDAAGKAAWGPGLDLGIVLLILAFLYFGGGRRR